MAVTYQIFSCWGNCWRIHTSTNLESVNISIVSC